MINFTHQTVSTPNIVSQVVKHLRQALKFTVHPKPSVLKREKQKCKKKVINRAGNKQSR